MLGEDVAAALGDGEAEVTGTTLHGLYFCICDSNFPRGFCACAEPAGVIGEPSSGGVICLAGIVSLATGEFEALGAGEVGAFCGDALALGTSNRPRRCDAVGEADGDEIGAEVADAAAVVLGTAVAVGWVGRESSGVAVAAADGAAVAVLDVDVEVALVCVVVSAFANLFGGAFGGGVASDFIFSRVFFASS